ncbi:MAG: GPP34 family phosphoprotein [Chromatiaceae bacterium]|nr:GPP34 family phosphoprotein [Chromatiaceae bacterium]
MKKDKSSQPEPQTDFGIAESFLLLSFEWPVVTDPLIAWSDADFGLAGAILMDLSMAGKVDSDLKNLIILDLSPVANPAQNIALRLLGQLGQTVSMDIALNALANRVGDIRAACLVGLAARNIQLTTSSKLNWGFRQSAINKLRVPEEVASLRTSLAGLIDSDELPLPEQAAIISLLCACDIVGPVLGGRSYQHWLLANAPRIESIRRMDLVGHAVVTAVAAMRLRLRTYLLDAVEQKPQAPLDNANKSTAPATDYTRNSSTWEWRAFWPEGETVELPASWASFNNNSEIAEEENEDHYLFVHGKKDNIKIRGKGLKIKPVLEAFDEFIAFGPSAKFRFPEKPLLLAAFLPRLYEVRRKIRGIDELLQIMSVTGYQPSIISVSKKRQGSSMMFGVQIEFARIQVNGRIYHSISLESPYLTALRILARNLSVGSGQVAGYSDFLERVIRS